MGSLRDALTVLFAKEERYEPEYMEEEAPRAQQRRAGGQSLQAAISRRKARSLGLPTNLNSEALRAIAISLENVLDRKYSFEEEQLIIDWVHEVDNVLSSSVDANGANIQINPQTFDARLERYYMNFLGSDPVQFIKLECYAVLLWVECNKGICPQEDWICSMISSFLEYLDSVSSYTRAQRPLGPPAGPWDPSYNPAGTQGLYNDRSTPEYGVAPGPNPTAKHYVANPGAQMILPEQVAIQPPPLPSPPPQSTKGVQRRRDDWTEMS